MAKKLLGALSVEYWALARDPLGLCGSVGMWAFVFEEAVLQSHRNRSKFVEN